MFKWLHIRKKTENNKVNKETIPNEKAPPPVPNLENEIVAYQELLSYYGISFTKLPNISPTSQDTKEILIDMARKISREEHIMKTLQLQKTLPLTDIVETFSVSKRLVKKNSQYLIAITLLQIEQYAGVRKFMRV
ncbi:hypothetical protein U8V72_14380 [Priestia filamentosa]|uniref:hypothetical protein n=1 Tax=Priestia filamentosa TaxID=1402861 RepID=UPI00397CD1FA